MHCRMIFVSLLVSGSVTSAIFLVAGTTVLDCAVSPFIILPFAVTVRAQILNQELQVNCNLNEKELP